MPGGELFSSHERFTLDETIRKAEQLSRVEFSLFVGAAEDETRAFATRLHNSLVAPARSILIMVDPDARALEIVTGGYVRRTLRDHEAELAALAQSGSAQFTAPSPSSSTWPWSSTMRVSTNASARPRCGCCAMRCGRPHPRVPPTSR